MVYATVIIFVFVSPRAQMMFYCVGSFKADSDIGMSKKITTISCYIFYVWNGCPFAGGVWGMVISFRFLTGLCDVSFIVIIPKYLFYYCLFYGFIFACYRVSIDLSVSTL